MFQNEFSTSKKKERNYYKKSSSTAYSSIFQSITIQNCSLINSWIFHSTSYLCFSKCFFRTMLEVIFRAVFWIRNLKKKIIHKSMRIWELFAILILLLQIVSRQFYLHIWWKQISRLAFCMMNESEISFHFEFLS